MRKLIKQALMTVALCTSIVGTAGTITHSESFPSSGLRMWQDTICGEQYTQLSFEGLNILSMPGVPKLPVKYIRLVVPYNATNFTVNCTYGSVTTSSVSDYVIPGEEPQMANESFSEGPIFIPDSVIYNSNALYPTKSAEIASEGYFMGENHVVTIALYPIRYNPVTGLLVHCNNLTATINYDISHNYTNLLMRNNNTAREIDQTELASLVANPCQIASFAPQVQNPSLSFGDNTHEGLAGSEYNIITTRALAPAFKRFIALKRQKGYSVGTICVEDIMQNPLINGGDVNRDDFGNVVSVLSDSASIIRAYLKGIYTGHSRYLLLGGRNVPYAKATYDNYSVPTDWYFSDLSTKWEKIALQQDTCIIPLNTLDKNPELYVGRLMADNGEDIRNYTNKLVRYELNPGKNHKEYLRNVLAVEGSEYFDNRHVVASQYKLSSFDVDTINQIVRVTDYLNCYPTGPQIINMAKNYGILSIHGHGGPYTTSVNNYRKYKDPQNPSKGVYNSEQQRICALDTCDVDMKRPVKGNGLELMNNKDNPNIFYSWSCTTMPYDNSNPDNPTKRYTLWNMGQSFTLGKDYGGVAYLGDTRNGYVSFLEYEVEFAKLLTSNYHIGEVEAISKNRLPTHYFKDYFPIVHNLMGDPELSVWTSVPQKLNNIMIDRTNNGITIHGIAADSAVVAWCNWESSGKMYATNGSVTLPSASLNSSIMVYSHNYLPYIAPLVLQNCEINQSQYVITNGFVAGSNVDNNRTSGEVVVKSGVNYEIENNSGVILSPGFTVERGASLTILQTEDFLH